MTERGSHDADVGVDAIQALLGDFVGYAGRRGYLAIAYILGGALLESVSISLLVPLLALVFNTGTKTGRLAEFAGRAFRMLGADTELERLLLLLGVFCVLMPVRSVIKSERDVLLTRLQLGFVDAKRFRIVEGLAAAKWEFVARLRHARITQIMGGDVQRLGVGMHFVLQAAAACAMLLALCAVAFLLAPGAAVVILMLLAGSAIALRHVLAHARALGTHVASENLLLADNATQFLGGLKLAVSQHLENDFVEETRRSLRRLLDEQITYTRRHARGQVLVTALSTLSTAAVVVVGLFWIHLTPAVMIALLLVVVRMMAPLTQIQQGAQQLGYVSAIYESLQRLDVEIASSRRPTWPERMGAVPASKIRFTDVSFLYEKVAFAPRPARGLYHFNIAIEPGEFVGVTGPSGSGKTTFADLLVGLYPPQYGQITVGGVPLEGELLSRWMQGLSYVPQDPFLFHSTIRRNLLWGSPGAGEDEMWQALATAGAECLVRSMQNGLDTVVGERGTLISGGERQRLALARGLLRRPGLLVLDEATGAIDGNGEREILVNLSKLAHRPTIVLIAHRMDNLSICDRVVQFQREQAAVTADC